MRARFNFVPGVTSYSIDLESKKVTVVGHVSPDGVLESISKVKRAEFWPNEDSSLLSDQLEIKSSDYMTLWP